MGYIGIALPPLAGPDSRGKAFQYFLPVLLVEVFK